MTFRRFRDKCFIDRAAIVMPQHTNRSNGEFIQYLIFDEHFLTGIEMLHLMRILAYLAWPRAFKRRNEFERSHIFMMNWATRALGQYLKPMVDSLWRHASSCSIGASAFGAVVVAPYTVASLNINLTLFAFAITLFHAAHLTLYRSLVIVR